MHFYVCYGLCLKCPQRFGEYCGVILLSLCYDQLNKKLSVIILRAKDLNKGKSDETGELSILLFS